MRKTPKSGTRTLSTSCSGGERAAPLACPPASLVIEGGMLPAQVRHCIALRCLTHSAVQLSPDDAQLRSTHCARPGQALASHHCQATCRATAGIGQGHRQQAWGRQHKLGKAAQAWEGSASLEKAAQAWKRQRKPGKGGASLEKAVQALKWQHEPRENTHGVRDNRQHTACCASARERRRRRQRER